MLNRDSILWYLIVLGAVLAYLQSTESPADWHYDDWIKAASFVVATIAGKLSSSPLPGAKS
jgi:hypothetical protein